MWFKEAKEAKEASGFRGIHFKEHWLLSMVHGSRVDLPEPEVVAPKESVAKKKCGLHRVMGQDTWQVITNTVGDHSPVSELDNSLVAMQRPEMSQHHGSVDPGTS